MLPLSSPPLLTQKASFPLSWTPDPFVGPGQITDAAPRITQLSSVDPKSALHFNNTPSSIPNSPLGSSMRRNRISLKFFNTWVGEWCVTPPVWWSTSPSSSEPPPTAREEEVVGADLLGPKNWPRAWRGFTMPPNTRRKRCEKGPRDFSKEPAAEEDSSSEITQSTRTTTFSTCGTRVWKRLETTQQRPSALTSPILLKTRRSRESGKRSKWSMASAIIITGGGLFWGSGQILVLGSGRIDEAIPR